MRDLPLEQEAALGELDAVGHDVEVVEPAVVDRGPELDRVGALRVRLRVREDDAELVDLAADVVDAVGLVVEDVADARRHPDDLHVLVRRPGPFP